MNKINNQNPSETRRLRRRAILASAAAGGAAMLLAPEIAQAADAGDDMVPAKASNYPKQAFSQTGEAAALQAMYGKTSAESTDEIRVDAPDIAENGAVVPVVLRANLSNVTSMSILALDNPYTLAASYKLPPGTDQSISSRIKLAKTTTVVGIVEADGKLYSASKQVKVTLGGCG